MPSRRRQRQRSGRRRQRGGGWDLRWLRGRPPPPMPKCNLRPWMGRMTKTGCVPATASLLKPARLVLPRVAPRRTLPPLPSFTPKARRQTLSGNAQTATSTSLDTEIRLGKHGARRQKYDLSPERVPNTCQSFERKGCSETCQASCHLEMTRCGRSRRLSTGRRVSQCIGWSAGKKTKQETERKRHRQPFLT